MRVEAFTVAELQIIHLISKTLNESEWQKAWKTPEWEAAARLNTTQELIEKTKQELLQLEAKGQLEWLPVLPAVYVSASTDAALLKKLQSHARELEQTLAKDWHPNSNDMVLDLVHPSLYPLVWGRSMVLQNQQLKQLEAYIPPPPPRHSWQRTGEEVDAYQWLPTVFKVGANGEVEIQDYINNLHPKTYGHMYPTLAAAFQQMIPAFEQLLSVAAEKDVKRRVDLASMDYDFYEPLVRNEKWTDDEYEEAWDLYHETRQPKPLKWHEDFDLLPKPTVSLSGSSLQVIVKMANIHLEPTEGKDRYDGGVWHIEATKRENIVATGIVYYDSENITESKLSFRAGVEDPPYEQGDTNGVKTIFGLEDGDMLNQMIGSVSCWQGRTVVFPNFFQHKVESFELADKTKPGHRKILVFFLVDPQKPSEYTTSNVPFQQQEWGVKSMLQSTIGTSLPKELVELIADRQAGWMSREDALATRLDLMKGRSALKESLNAEFEEEFSLCEH
ncbi:hypothetical protein HDV03_003336 [Kappamyces sp. JEL0829]|nr:hypothetical protein HDV03_003336 [Kappamyces sp. JEL0829]